MNNKHHEEKEPGTDVEDQRKVSGRSSAWIIKSILVISVGLNVTFVTWMANKVQTMSENIATLVQWKSEGERTDARNEQSIVVLGADVKDHAARIVVLETKAGIVRSP